MVDAEDVKVAGAVAPDEWGSITTLPFKNDTFSVEVNVSVVVMSGEVNGAEEL